MDQPIVSDRAQHPDIQKRLRRAEGHLRAVQQMLAAGRPCLDLAQQLDAVEKAIGQAKRILIQDHIDHCLDRAIEAGDAGSAVAEFRALVKYL